MENIEQKSALQFLDSDSNGFQKCFFKENIATAKDFNVYLFGKHSIHKNPIFSITFLKMANGGGVGIVDSKLKFSSFIAYEPNVVTYRSDKTCRTGTETKEGMGKGYQAHEEVNVTIDIQNYKVVWSVNGQIRHSVSYQLIKNEQIQWVPYIRLCDKGDKVQINFK